MQSAMLFGIVLIPIAIALVATFGLKLDINPKELAIQVVGGILVVSMVWLMGSSFAGADKEVWNGQIESKRVWRFSCPINTSNPCRNSYSCNCRQVPYPCTNAQGKSDTCYRTECDTCYVYDWEQNWLVKPNIAGEVEIARVDRQGADMPRRWQSVKPGDPYSETNSYHNWVKASSNSLFKEHAKAQERYAKLLTIKYPMQVFDYYQLNRVVSPNVKVPYLPLWNKTLSEANGRLGPKKQINMIIVFVEGVEPDYAGALQRQWEGFKKNDAILFIGTQNGKIEWGDSLSWSKNKMYDFEMRHVIEQWRGQPLNAIDPRTFMINVEATALQHFERRPMKEFEYLKGDIVPPTWLVTLAIIVAILWGIGTSYVFHRNDF